MKSLGARIGPWLKQRSPAQKWLLLVLSMVLLALYWGLEARDLWRTLWGTR
jgi:hypothetical protein